MTQVVKSAESAIRRIPAPLRVVIGACIVLPLAGVLLAHLSKTPPPSLGLVDGKLAVGSSKPNWVSSDIPPDHPRYVDPIPIHDNPQTAWLAFQQSVTDIGGIIVSHNDHYLHATFQSPLFGFVDDLEARLDSNTPCIHLRSASRIGGYDFQANHNRIQQLRK